MWYRTRCRRLFTLQLSLVPLAWLFSELRMGIAQEVSSTAVEALSDFNQASSSANGTIAQPSPSPAFTTAPSNASINNRTSMPIRLTFAPTISKAPTRPNPTAVPTKSHDPTLSANPSSTPSLSANPSVSSAPSSEPTASRVPGQVVASNAPTSRPSQVPSLAPTGILQTVKLSSIVMVVDGFTELFKAREQTIWEGITSGHIADFFEKINSLSHVAYPIRISEVHTRMTRHDFVPQFSGRRNLQEMFEGPSSLRIEYEQDITFAEVNNSEHNPEELFMLPFQLDWYPYNVKLTKEFNIDSLLILRSLSVPMPAPTGMPVESTTIQGISGEGGLTQVGVAMLSVAIVLIVIAAVSYTLHRKFSREDRSRSNGSTRDGEVDFGYTQQALEWRDPYGIQQPHSANTMTTAPTVGTTGLSLNSNTEERNDRPISNDSNNIVEHQLFHGSDFSRTRELSNDRDARDSTRSITQHSHMTDLTDVTDFPRTSEHEEFDNHVGPSFLPIDRDMYGVPEADGPLSPVHIPDEEERGEIENEEESPEILMAPTSSSAQDILGLEEQIHQPSLTGFEMEIEELE